MLSCLYAFKSSIFKGTEGIQRSKASLTPYKGVALLKASLCLRPDGLDPFPFIQNQIRNNSKPLRGRIPP